MVKRVDGAPIVLVGTKKDLRDQRAAIPSVGHSTPGRFDWVRVRLYDQSAVPLQVVMLGWLCI